MNTNNETPCQSCGMPMTEESHFGTEADGSKNQEYCVYCYKDGAFTSDCTMEEMIEVCLDIDTDYKKYGCADRAEAKKAMMDFYPTLTRWKSVQ